MKILLSIVGLLCLATCATGENKKPRLGMWSWEQLSFETEIARNEMLNFCQQEEISHIDQHIRIKDGAIENADAFQQLIVQASKRNISINALRGDKEMFFADNHQGTLADLKIVVGFNAALTKDARLLGIKYDVEPYLTPQWKADDTSREKVMLDYLQFLVKANLFLKENATDFELAVDVPFWWDEPAYKVTFAGDHKPFVNHILDAVAWTGIMAYRRDPDATIKLVSDELRYVKNIGRLNSISPALETEKGLGEHAEVSFAGVPTEEFRIAIEGLRRRYTGDRHVRFIMLHHYESLRGYLTSPADKSKQRISPPAVVD